MPSDDQQGAAMVDEVRPLPDRRLSMKIPLDYVQALRKPRVKSTANRPWYFNENGLSLAVFL